MINVPPLAFSVILPALPAPKLLLIVVVPVLPTVNVPLLNVPTPLIVMLFVPPMLVEPPTLNALANVDVKLDCNVPPFNASEPLPNALVAAPTCNVPAVNVVVPE